MHMYKKDGGTNGEGACVGGDSSCGIGSALVKSNKKDHRAEAANCEINKFYRIKSVCLCWMRKTRTMIIVITKIIIKSVNF